MVKKLGSIVVSLAIISFFPATLCWSGPEFHPARGGWGQGTYWRNPRAITNGPASPFRARA